MRKYSFLSTYIVVLIILYIGFITTTNAIVGNICTSASVKELNKTITTGVTVKVKEKEWILGSKIRVKVDVGKKKLIRNIIIWAETVDGMHIGDWSPISAHVYVNGCNGPANSTITNNVDLNLSQMTYEWNPSNNTQVTTTSTYSSKAATAPTPSISSSTSNILYELPTDIRKLINTKFRNNHSSAKRDSIIFKGVLQLMNHTDDEIYSFKSGVIQKCVKKCVIQKSVSNNENSILGKDYILNVSSINDNVPKNPPFSAAHNNNFNLLVLNSVLALIISFFILLW